MKTVTIGQDETISALGQGTWYMGDLAANRPDEVAALRRGVELGMQIIDTAEMYGSGKSERVVGEAIEPIREEVFLVSKVLPHNASRRGTISACEASLQRLGTDRIDLYLLHWPGPHPLADTVAAFEELQASGKIRYWGVSNFDPVDLQELVIDTRGGDKVATNQILYNLTRRGIEWDLLPKSEESGLPLMAYSPIEQARLLKDTHLRSLADDLGITVSQLALAWVLRRRKMIAIPKSGNVKHVEENAKAAEIDLPDDALSMLDSMFPPPKGASPLEIL